MYLVFQINLIFLVYSVTSSVFHFSNAIGIPNVFGISNVFGSWDEGMNSNSYDREYHPSGPLPLWGLWLPSTIIPLHSLLLFPSPIPLYILLCLIAAWHESLHRYCSILISHRICSSFKLYTLLLSHLLLFLLPLLCLIVSKYFCVFISRCFWPLIVLLLCLASSLLFYVALARTSWRIQKREIHFFCVLFFVGLRNEWQTGLPD